MHDEIPKEPADENGEKHNWTYRMGCQHRQSNWDKISYQQKYVNFFFFELFNGKKSYHLKRLTQNYTGYNYKQQLKRNWNIALIHSSSVIFVREKYSVNITISEKFDFKN